MGFLNHEKIFHGFQQFIPFNTFPNKFIFETLINQYSKKTREKIENFPRFLMLQLTSIFSAIISRNSLNSTTPLPSVSAARIIRYKQGCVIKFVQIATLYVKFYNKNFLFVIIGDLH